MTRPRKDSPLEKAVGGWYRNAREEIIENSSLMVSEKHLARAYERILVDRARYASAKRRKK